VVSAQAKAYNSVFEAVGAIIIAALMGWFADDYFDTKPRYLIIGVIIGFAAFVLRLMRMAKDYQASLEASEGSHETAGDAGDQREEREGREKSRKIESERADNRESEIEEP